MTVQNTTKKATKKKVAKKTTKKVAQNGEMTKTQRAKVIRDLADSILVRNHIFTLVNTGRTNKDETKRLMKFIAYIDNEIVTTSLAILPSDTAPPVNSNEAAFVEAREKKKVDVVQRDNKAKQLRAQLNKKSTGSKSGVMVSRST